ncbi:MAG TPA: AarF/ABC1/UbiB kinase family protein [Acidimicrobiales bacterium]|nr:AarF/ABC1/UbiB kinase family protein [Acidimicrobiales bacterium]
MARRGVVIGSAVAGALLVGAALRRRRRSAADDPALVPAMSTAWSERNAAVAKLAVQTGAGVAAHRAQRVFASAERRQELDERLQLRTAEQVADALGNLKGALMKIGQLASFLDDGMPEPVRQALAQLQQNAPPMSAELAAQVVEQELGGAPDAVFAEWDPEPLAAASIGQVHRAVSPDGRLLAVKVQYPGVDEAVRADLANLDLAGFGLGSLFPGLDAPSMVAELRERLTEELDYTIEAANQRAFAEWYRGHPFIRVPEVLAQFSTARVLTSELATGARFDEMEQWPQAERDLAGEAIYRFVFRSLYRFHAFNGDPHPGNYLFHGDGHVTFLDFGLVKHLTDDEVAQTYRLVRASVVDKDPVEVRRACEAVGLIARDAPIGDDRVFEFMRIFWEAVERDEVTTITAEWASQVARRYFEGRSTFGDVMAHAGMPPSMVVLQRINLGLLAILGRLEATANWRRVAAELWPEDAPPSTELGREERSWWERTHGGL